MDDSITPQEVVDAIADVGSCSKDNIKIGAIRRRWNTGMGSVWAQCPVTTVKKLAAVGRIKIRWVSTKVEILPPRPLQCFRCLETGQVKQQCTSEKDRTGQCFSCGETGHTTKICPGTPKCPLCSDRKLEANHRLGSKACSSTAVGQTDQRPKKGTQISGLPQPLFPPLIGKPYKGKIQRTPARLRIQKRRGHKRKEWTLKPDGSKTHVDTPSQCQPLGQGTRPLITHHGRGVDTS